jgi:hypothetical protein
MVNSINNSAYTIDRNKIRDIKFKKAFIGLTRSHFEVIFEDEKRKIKTTYHASLTNGQMEKIKH